MKRSPGNSLENWMIEAFEGNLVSIDEWRKYAREAKTEGNEEILQFENYEIAVTEEECIIRPLRR